MINDETRRTLDVISAVLLRCLLLGFALLLVWFVLIVTMGDWAYSIHGRLFDVTKKEFDLLCYCGMAFVKLVVFVGFLIPWAATKLVLRST